jgi:hypothetical protein
MLQWLIDLPKIIDAFITGVIEFCYRFLGGVWMVSRKPLTGARELEQNEEHLTSRTMLFGAATVFIVTVVFSISNAGALSGTGLVYFFVLVIAIYIAIDLTCAVASRYCARKPEAEPVDKIRDYLRYGFAASLTVAAIVVPTLGAVSETGGALSDPSQLGKAATLGLLSLVLLVLIVLTLYQPVAIFVMLAGWARRGFGLVALTTVLTAVLSIASGFALLAFVQYFAQLRETVDGPMFVMPVSCTATPGGVRAVMIVENASLTATYISRRTLDLELVYPGQGSEKLDLIKVEGDAVIVQSRAFAKLVVEARPVSPAYAAFLKNGRPGTCQAIKADTTREYETSDTAPLEIGG